MARVRYVVSRTTSLELYLLKVARFWLKEAHPRPFYIFQSEQIHRQNWDGSEMEGSYPNLTLTLSWPKIIWKSPKYQILIMVPMLWELITEFKVDLAIRSKFQVFFIYFFDPIYSTYELIWTNYESTNPVFANFFHQYLLWFFSGAQIGENMICTYLVWSDKKLIIYFLFQP